MPDYATISEPDEGTEGPDKGDSGSELLVLCREEMRRAIGFDQDAELRDDRERALNFFKGDVSKEIASLPNRSAAVSSDVSDAIETLLPDLIEIFIGGDDVVSFIPQKASDVEAAKQETAYLHHVAFQENPGFLNLYTAIKDALLLKTGVFHWEWEKEINEQEEHFTGKNAVELQLSTQDGEVTDVKPEREDIDLRMGEQTYSFTVTKRTDNSRAKYWAVAPDDFAAAPDTVNIAETTYCCERQRPRVQDLIAQGFDAEKVRNLPRYTDDDTTLQLARDTAGEHMTDGSEGDDTNPDLRQVEVRKHCIRTLGDENKLELWCVYTDAEATVELYREELDAIPYAVGSPYLVAHRLIGRSVADLLIEVMKIKTALYRMTLDSGYFALNQRNEVAMDRANDYTISDLLRNEPMVPVRSKSGDAVRPLAAAGLGFDAYKAIEFFSTVAEGRTGVVRNAQGLNPDTLHDTAKGAMMLLSAAQKRTRMIARVLAETLIKPLFLGLHSCIRQNAEATREAQLLGKWVPVDPTRWAERNAMTVEVGLGAAGKDAEIAAVNSIAADMALIVEQQGGAQGPLVTYQNVYKLATDKAKKLGVKAPEEYYTDPSSPEGKAAIEAMANRPDPGMAKVQMEGQIKQAGLQQDGQIKAAQIAQEGQQKQAQAQTDAVLASQKLQQEGELKRYQIDQELILKREQLAAELQLKREQMAAELAIQRELGHAKVNAGVGAGTSEVRPGGEPG
jgi:hypothetical protein